MEEARAVFNRERKKEYNDRATTIALNRFKHLQGAFNRIDSEEDIRARLGLSDEQFKELQEAHEGNRKNWEREYYEGYDEDAQFNDPNQGVDVGDPPSFEFSTELWLRRKFYKAHTQNRTLTPIQ